jgi:hypothetical protein
MKRIEIDNLIEAGYFSVDSGQAMVGDPCYLDGWKTNEGEEWDLEGAAGSYSYFGASATTIANSFGELGIGNAVVFNTGHGVGYYPVYVQMNEDGLVARVVIEFIGDKQKSQRDNVRSTRSNQSES